MSSSSPTVSVPPFFCAKAGLAMPNAATAASASHLNDDFIMSSRIFRPSSPCFAESLLEAEPTRDSKSIGESLGDRPEIAMMPADTAGHARRRAGIDMEAALGHGGIDRSGGHPAVGQRPHPLRHQRTRPQRAQQQHAPLGRTGNRGKSERPP